MWFEPIERSGNNFQRKSNTIPRQAKCGVKRLRASSWQQGADSSPVSSTWYDTRTYVKSTKTCWRSITASFGGKNRQPIADGLHIYHPIAFPSHGVSRFAIGCGIVLANMVAADAFLRKTNRQRVSNHTCFAGGRFSKHKIAPFDREGDRLVVGMVYGNLVESRPVGNANGRLRVEGSAALAPSCFQPCDLFQSLGLVLFQLRSLFHLRDLLLPFARRTAFDMRSEDARLD
jgi:hypothetical protein